MSPIPSIGRQMGEALARLQDQWAIFMLAGWDMQCLVCRKQYKRLGWLRKHIKAKDHWLPPTYGVMELDDHKPWSLVPEEVSRAEDIEPILKKEDWDAFIRENPLSGYALTQMSSAIDLLIEEENAKSREEAT